MRELVAMYIPDPYAAPADMYFVLDMFFRPVRRMLCHAAVPDLAWMKSICHREPPSGFV